MTTKQNENQEPMIAVLGGGVMGETLLGSIMAAGWRGEHVLLSERQAGRASELARKHDVTKCRDNQAAATAADVVMLAVKPQDVGSLLEEIRPAVKEGSLVVSVAAGIPTSYYEARLAPGTSVVRVMPNTPAKVGQGVAAMSAGSHASAADLEIVERLLAQTGTVIRIAEKDQDAVTALTGSGPGYVFYIIDALAEAGVNLGLSRYLSRRLAAQTVLGSAALATESDEHPVILREQVTSPAGTTIAGIRELDERGVRAALVAAARAAYGRSIELGAGYASDDEVSAR